MLRLRKPRSSTRPLRPDRPGRLRFGSFAVSLALATSVLSAGVAFAGSSGQPMQPPADCAAQTGRTCLYTNSGFQGTRVVYGGINEVWASAIRNKDDSLYNNGTSGKGFQVYSKTSWRGSDLYCIPKGWGWTNISWWKDNNGESNLWPLNC